MFYKHRRKTLATKVYDTLEIELENGDVIELKPLAIKQLRKFMNVISKIEESEEQTELGAMDTFLAGAIVCLQGLYPEKFGSMKDEEIEELLTVPTMLKILEVAGGLKTADPNLMGAALVGMN